MHSNRNEFWDSRSPRSNGVATAGFIVGIVGFLLSWIPLVGIPIGHIMGVIAIILSIIGMIRASVVQTGRSTAAAGLVFGIVTVVLKSIPLLNLL
ncbi:hypothetical protein [Alicyclobacillus dauci]|uniref:DUF4190 domain-containing protein n=1 Tax=Alicyclobacillus dauci TaxID=1475485 RepID=A0ABY6Z289_9BACL|nr:hypothetical protein [Alicyclobacillus dauci]WAH37017.1 hypothetical protein NZD86_00065 [Alicyclobacillus dauci]